MHRHSTVQKAGLANGKPECLACPKGIWSVCTRWLSACHEPASSPPRRIDPRIEAEILAIRDEPPEGLRRTPGPKAILSYLPRRLTFWESHLRLPTSTRTVYEILKCNQRIAPRPVRPTPSDLP